ncbi:MAG: regulatory protein RecX [bacterium]
MNSGKRKITSLTITQNNKKCKIFVDNEYWDTISLDLIMKHKLTKDMNFDEKMEKLLKLEQRTIDLKQTAYNFAAYKPRTKKQVKERLQLKGFNLAEIEIAVNFLDDFQLLDDEKYAFTFAKEYVNRKSCGKPKLIAELFKKGISRELAEKAAEECLQQNDGYELARKAAQRKIKTLVNRPAEKQKQLLISFLQRQGFEWDIIKVVVEEML